MLSKRSNWLVCMHVYMYVLFVGLKVHIKRHRSTGDLNKPEDGCDKSFVSKSGSSSHAKAHSSDDDLPNDNSPVEGWNELFQCPENDCSQQFTSLTSLSMHFTEHKQNQENFQMLSLTDNSNLLHHSVIKRTNMSIEDNILRMGEGELSSNDCHTVRDEPSSSSVRKSPLTVDDQYFQQQYAGGHFNYISSVGSTSTTESISTENASDIVNLLNQSYFTIDDSDAALRLLSFLATRGNLHILNGNENPGNILNVSDQVNQSNAEEVSQEDTQNNFDTNLIKNTSDGEQSPVDNNMIVSSPTFDPVDEPWFQNNIRTDSVIKCPQNAHECETQKLFHQQEELENTSVMENIENTSSIENIEQFPSNFSQNNKPSDLFHTSTMENTRWMNGDYAMHYSTVLNALKNNCKCCKCGICSCKSTGQKPLIVSVVTPSVIT